MKIDLKSLIVGLAIGAMLMLAFGAGRDAGSVRSFAGFGFAVPSGGKALVKEKTGDAFIIDVDTGKADRILFKNPEPGTSKYPSNLNGYELKLSD